MKQQTKEDSKVVTSINLDSQLATLARIEAARLNISRSAFIQLLLERELGKLTNGKQVSTNA